MKRVYFLKPVGLDGPFKIGCSVDPDKRLATIAAWSPILLELVATVEGGHDLETALHCRFAHLAMHGEWFGVDDDLLAVVEEAKAGRLTADLPAGTRSTQRTASALKSAMSRRISDAERQAYGFRCNHGSGRPKRIQAIMDAYQGPYSAPPSVEDQAALTAYITELRARPQASRNFAERWRAWEAYRIHDVLPPKRRTRPTSEGQAA